MFKLAEPLRTRAARPEDEYFSRSLDRAIARSGHAIKGLAKALGRSEKTLREMRRGVYRVGLADVVLLPLEARREVVRDFVSKCGLDEPIAPEDFVNTIQKLLSEAGKAIGPLIVHGERGGFTRADAPEVRKHARAIADLARALERHCDTAEVEGYVRLPKAPTELEPR